MVQYLLGTTSSAFGETQPSKPLPPLPEPQSAPDVPSVALVQHSSSASSAPVDLPGSLSSQSNNTTGRTPTNPLNRGLNPFSCEFCHSRPKLFDGPKLHPYCGKTCASRAKKKNAKELTNGRARRQGMIIGAQPHIAAVKCRISDCQSPVYTNANGLPGKYCSMAHKILEENFCIMCLQAPKAIMSHFCSQGCADKVESGAPAILENPAGHITSGLHRLDPTDPDYGNLERQFIGGWQHPHKMKTRVRAVFRIVSPPSFYTDYFQHRDRILGDVSDGFPSEQLLFHGTNRACSLGEDGASTDLCQRPDCYLCSIIRNSFDITKCGTKNRFHRFGTGIYTTSVSSKADDYVQNVYGNMTTRALLLNRVIIGNPGRLTHNATNLLSPPTGCHSVIGEPGVDLKYEETVVYNNDAIRPAFLITYGEEVAVSKPKLKLRAVIKMLLNAPLVTHT
ncbi:ADP-ribosylation [Macrolepiota fuliginosa MF-IS2]|uniref:ADP-ribosylation n=1 Tax=Macrolepiota fuliginosa MF-IS2 TaxID=1400762 RepID=A0A9P6C0C2_9AGAR|nr:ADP-ribosylation [Macrolepiota fuliginosa MF-IS2]